MLHKTPKVFFFYYYYYYIEFISYLELTYNFRESDRCHGLLLLYIKFTHVITMT